MAFHRCATRPDRLLRQSGYSVCRGTAGRAVIPQVVVCCDGSPKISAAASWDDPGGGQSWRLRLVLRADDKAHAFPIPRRLISASTLDSAGALLNEWLPNGRNWCGHATLPWQPHSRAIPKPLWLDGAVGVFQPSRLASRVDSCHSTAIGHFAQTVERGIGQPVDPRGLVSPFSPLNSSFLRHSPIANDGPVLAGLAHG